MASEEKEPERGFTIVDRREEAEPKAPGAAAPPDPEALPSVDFSTFAISLGTSALYHMGLVDDPQTGQPSEKNSVLARQTIDTLAMLQEKTRGNLSEEETQLVENLLYELRMRFVEVEK